MIIVDGYKESEKIDEYIRKLAILNDGALAIIQIGDDASSNKYISIKQKVGDSVNVKTQLFKFSSEYSDEDLKEQISKVVTDYKNQGVIVQLPLPRKSLYSILDLIPLDKDIDLLSSEGQKKFYEGTGSFGSPVTRATEYILDLMKFNASGSQVLVVGRGFLVGNPIIKLLKDKGCNITVTDNYSKEEGLNKNLIVLSAGVPGLVKGDDLTEGTNVIDFGSTVIDKKTYGDLDMSSKIDHLGWVVPSPKGMGPLVVRFLFLNFLKSYSLDTSDF